MGCGKSKIKGEAYVEVPKSFWSITLTSIDGKNSSMYEFNKKKGFIVVNLPELPAVALKLCRKLNELHRSLSQKDVMVLGIITDLSKDNKESTEGKSTTVWESEAKFPVYSRVFANGQKAHQMFRFLRLNSHLYNTNTKRSLLLNDYGNMFLLDQDGNAVKLYNKSTSVSEVIAQIDKMISKT